MVSNCEICKRHQSRQQKETMLIREAPDRPWQHIGVDIFHFQDRNYLISVCYLSNYFEVVRLETMKLTEIIYHLRTQMSRWGISEKLYSDNSPFNGKLFKDFTKSYGIQHVTSSPNFPSSNGKSEAAVRICKRLMQKACENGTDPYISLLDYRNTPNEHSGLSPIEVMTGHKTRTTLPIAARRLTNETMRVAGDAMKIAKQKQVYYYNRQAKDKPPLKVGQAVTIFPDNKTAEWKPAVVTKILPYRSYQVSLPDGTERRRNRRHIRWSPHKPTMWDPDVERTERPTAGGAEMTANRPLKPIIKQSIATTAPEATRLNINKGPTPSPTTPGRDSVNDNMPRAITPIAELPLPVTTRSGRIIKLPARYRD